MLCKLLYATTLFNSSVNLTTICHGIIFIVSEVFIVYHYLYDINYYLMLNNSIALYPNF